jgi:parallel beta-helix repeat protein
MEEQVSVALAIYSAPKRLIRNQVSQSVAVPRRAYVMGKNLLAGNIVIILVLFLSVQSPSAASKQFQMTPGSDEQPADGGRETIPKDLLPSEPIVIDGDDDFVAQGFSGSGIETDPYIIEGLHINLNGTPSSWCIRVLQTTSHFEIRNCLLQGQNYWESGVDLYDGEGIELQTVANAYLSNNTFYLISRGIAAYNSENLTIKDNSFPGVLSEYSGVVGVGIYGMGSFCRNVEIRNNTLAGGRYDDGIIVRYGLNVGISENVLKGGHGISIANSNHCVVTRNVVENCSFGIGIHGHFNSITENNCTGSRSTGIFVGPNSANNTIHKNICTENGEEIVQGWEGGISLLGATSHNNVTWNRLIDNIRNALDDGLVMFHMRFPGQLAIQIPSRLDHI